MPRRKKNRHRAPVTPDRPPEVLFALELSDEEDDDFEDIIFAPVETSPPPPQPSKMSTRARTPSRQQQGVDTRSVTPTRIPISAKKKKRRSSLSTPRKASGPQWRDSTTNEVQDEEVCVDPVISIDVTAVKQAPCDDPTKYCGFCCEMDKPRNLLTCSQCGNSGHQSCMKINDRLANNIRKNTKWLCIECKVCSVCCENVNDDLLLFCDSCDDGLHSYCHDPPLMKMPKGAFECVPCKTGESRKSKRGRKSLRSEESQQPTSRKRSMPHAPSPILEPKKKKDKEKPKEKRKPRIEGEIPVSEEDEKMFERARAAASKKLLSARGKNYSQKKLIQIGRYEIETWYQAPYPEEYMRLSTIYLCEFCIKYMKSEEMLRRHQAKCEMNGHPPGNEIYRDGKLQMWEVDGQKAKIYCQNICLLAKLFLDHKTLYYDVEPFLFYVLTERDEYGAHLVGYFSKEKNSILNYNVSCILTLPYAQRKGYGTFLIDFSYLLTRVEKKTGSPEKPLSSLGELTYKYYWKEAILRLFAYEEEDVEETSIYDVGYKTGMTCADVISTMRDLHMLKEHEGNLTICKHTKDIEDFKDRLASKTRIIIDPAKLRWIPLIKRPAWA